MRLTVFCALICTLLLACNTAKKTADAVPSSAKSEKVVAASTTEKPQPEPRFIKWDKTHVNLGTVKKGDKRELSYEFTNVYNETLEIEIISACHCTELKHTNKPIPPGGSYRIDAIFDSKEKDVAETIYIDVIFKNEDPRSGYPIVEQVTYYFEIDK